MCANRFENLNEWQKARELTRGIYLLTSKGNFAKDWALTNQMRRAAISIQSNIAEGFDSIGNPKYIQFLGIAKASTAELRSQLYTALDLDLIAQSEFDRLFKELIHLSRMLSNHIQYLKQHDRNKKDKKLNSAQVS